MRRYSGHSWESRLGRELSLDGRNLFVAQHLASAVNGLRAHLNIRRLI